jgi:hypothetical protein
MKKQTKSSTPKHAPAKLKNLAPKAPHEIKGGSSPVKKDASSTPEG